MLGQVPVTADVPRFVRSLDGLAASSGVTLDTVTPSAAQVLDANGALVGGGAPHGCGERPGRERGRRHGHRRHGVAGGASGAAQVVAVPITVTVHGPYFKAVSFLKELQSGQRAFLVTGLQVAVAGSDVTLTVKGKDLRRPRRRRGPHGADVRGRHHGAAAEPMSRQLLPRQRPTAPSRRPARRRPRRGRRRAPSAATPSAGRGGCSAAPSCSVSSLSLRSRSPASAGPS